MLQAVGEASSVDIITDLLCALLESCYSQMEFICFIHHYDTAYPAKIIHVFKNAHGDDLHGD